ncbi:MAG TPA: nicotinate phosphoribosyltransferase [Candidatus Binatia bacterium]|nr:nicotinate phosphoribosyltransferase [Candidatus Binatia bacterium]
MIAGENQSLLTDFYQLTMAQAYFREQQLGLATFSLFIRNYPPNRGYFVSAGLQDVLDYLESFHFEPAQIDYLASQSLFSDDFLRYLVDLRFTGQVFAVPEGRIFFTDEPVLELTAPIIQAQIVETYIINQIHLQSLIATKASRCVHAAGGRPVVDFALRRTHGSDAGMKVARASYLAGFAGTSNVMAGLRYGIPLVGTMAHSFIASFEDEIDAFRAYVASFPNNAILLIDTYDTLAGAKNAVQVARELAGRGQALIGVRIDSGDMAALAVEVRRIFNAAGLENVKIIGSGGLDEFALERLTDADAPFDSYGVGTKMGVSADAPWADVAYKLVDYQERPVLKLSVGKESWPGKKQVFRRVNSKMQIEKDIVGLRGEELSGERLLEEKMRNGRATSPYPKLPEMRERLTADLAALPKSAKQLRDPARFAAEFSPKATGLRDEIAKKNAR